jgi:hypothetical protein
MQRAAGAHVDCAGRAKSAGLKTRLQGYKSHQRDEDGGEGKEGWRSMCQTLLFVASADEAIDQDCQDSLGQYVTWIRIHDVGFF